MSSSSLLYKLSAFFQNLCNPCVSVHALSLLSYMHLFELGQDLENSLDCWEGKIARVLVPVGLHESHSFRKKVDT